MMSLAGLYALLKTPLRAITTGRVLTLMTATIITNYNNMKLLDIFKRKKNAAWIFSAAVDMIYEKGGSL